MVNQRPDTMCGWSEWDKCKSKAKGKSQEGSTSEPKAKEAVWMSMSKPKDHLTLDKNKILEEEPERRSRSVQTREEGMRTSVVAIRKRETKCVKEPSTGRTSVGSPTS